MEPILAPLLLIVGAALGGAVAWWLRGREVAAAQNHAAAVAAAERQAIDGQLTALTTVRGEFEQTIKGPRR